LPSWVFFCPVFFDASYVSSRALAGAITQARVSLPEPRSNFPRLCSNGKSDWKIGTDKNLVLSFRVAEFSNTEITVTLIPIYSNRLERRKCLIYKEKMAFLESFFQFSNFFKVGAAKKHHLDRSSFLASAPLHNF
jgi:hypothetical protein